MIDSVQEDLQGISPLEAKKGDKEDRRGLISIEKKGDGEGEKWNQVHSQKQRILKKAKTCTTKKEWSEESGPGGKRVPEDENPRTNCRSRDVRQGLKKKKGHRKPARLEREMKKNCQGDLRNLQTTEVDLVSVKGKEKK